MDRRTLLASALAAGGAAPIRAWAQPAAAGPDPAVIQALARDAYLFALPLLEVCRTRDNALAAGLPANTFNHRRNLAGPADRGVTTPNNDTLYSTAFLDLRKGPVSVTSPASPNRYFSLAFMDAWSNNFHIAGTRTDGGRARKLLLATETQAATLKPGPDVQLIVSPTNWVWALGRTLTDGGADLPAARAVQDGITASGEAGPPPPKAPPRNADLQTLLTAIQPLAADAGILKADLPALLGLARRAIVLGVGLDGQPVDPAVKATGEAALNAVRASLRGAAAAQQGIDGWTYPKPNLGDFGTDYPYRAAIAMAGLAALPPKEAMYMWAVGAGGPNAPPRTFDGTKAWRLDLPKLPIDSFWSLSMYEVTPEGSSFFVENPLHRYAIGDRTPGLVRTPEGGAVIWIGSADPGGTRRANWLPAPAGPFALVLRAYLPRPELLEGRFRLPPVKAA